jgi:hypothetical protein
MDCDAEVFSVSYLKDDMNLVLLGLHVVSSPFYGE